MRLINADEFAIEEPKLWDWSSVDGISSTAVLKQCIWDVQCAPEVKAIPIEWINKYIDSTLDEGNSQMLGFKAAIIKEMIEEWEKENEVNR